MNIKGHHLDAQKIKTSTMKKSIDSGVVLKVVPGTSHFTKKLKVRYITKESIVIIFHKQNLESESEISHQRVPLQSFPRLHLLRALRSLQGGRQS